MHLKNPRSNWPKSARYPWGGVNLTPTGWQPSGQHHPSAGLRRHLCANRRALCRMHMTHVKYSGPCNKSDGDPVRAEHGLDRCWCWLQWFGGRVEEPTPPPRHTLSPSDLIRTWQRNQCGTRQNVRTRVSHRFVPTTLGSNLYLFMIFSAAIFCVILQGFVKTCKVL